MLVYSRVEVSFSGYLDHFEGLKSRTNADLQGYPGFVYLMGFLCISPGNAKGVLADGRFHHLACGDEVPECRVEGA